MAVQPTMPPKQPMMPPALTSAAAGPGGKPLPVPTPGKPGAPGGAPAAAGAPPVLPPDEHSGPQLTFFQLPWVQTVLPFATSLLAHAAIIVVGGLIFAVATGVVDVKKLISQDQTVIPEATTADQGPVGGVPNVGTGGDPTKQMMQDTTPDAGTPDGNSSKAGPSVEPSSEGGGAGEGAVADLLTAGGSGSGAGNGRFGPGSGTGNGGGDGKGGPLAQFGPPGGGGIGPKGPVFGHGGNARRIVFICDATGTMINKLSTLKAQLQQTVQGLRPSQAFNIVFYTDGGKVLVANKEGLMIANADNKRNAFKWLEDVTSSGTTDPVPAIEMAFKLQPAADLVYFLSDGEFNNLKSYEEVSAALNKANTGAGGHAKVNTILFETFDKQAEEVMQKMAKDNKGKYVYVKQEDLQE